MSTKPISSSAVSVSKRRKPERLERSPDAIQLMFFEALCGSPKDTGYTLAFYEAIPKFRLTHRRYSEKSELWETSFRWEDSTIKVKIIPALIQRDPKSTALSAVIPGPREELVWRVLVELAAEQAGSVPVSQGIRTQLPFAPVRFTLTGLRDRLAARDKSYNVSELKEALIVLKRAECEFDHPMGQSFSDYSNYIVHLHFRGDKLDDGSTADTCIVHLNPLATDAILKLKGWPIDNARVLKLSQSLARWLITRIHNRYRQAKDASVLENIGYSLLLSTIIQESGMDQGERLRDSIKRVRAALVELTEAGYFFESKPYIEEIIYVTVGATKQRAIADVKWTFFPSSNLADYIIEGNTAMEKRREKVSKLAVPAGA